ncbi:hypothetical protein DL240_18240 [Lujinxingia litoralis]|uniref:Uncharacterized protein n=1 Tax=Lujinxingia litoralis TaxID=2211119 RepID=A0A328C0P8_9DELT|nr:hypothetical protein [Lujinxingia litoralis]RAL20158.1 hypothetical protein DL240_18240 [Lujinxingia litoralis]
MSTYEITHTIRLPAEHPAPLDALGDFFVHNGYMPRPSEDAELMLTRGTPGAGWRTSEMSGLGTELRLQALQEEVQAHYIIDVRGQRLNDTERAFWKREVRAAEAFLTDPEQLVDVRDQEQQRARIARRRMRRGGLTAAIATAFIVSALFFLISQLGLV